MTAVTVRKVPDDVLHALKIRAAESGRSFQEYLVDLLVREVSTPTLGEAVARMRAHVAVDLGDADITEVIDEGRDHR